MANDFYHAYLRPFWVRYHNHVYGVIGALGTAVTLLISCWPDRPPLPPMQPIAEQPPPSAPPSPPPSQSPSWPLPKVRIVELLPSPIGPDATGEYVAIQNFDAAAVDLTGWKLRDEASDVWLIDPQLPLAPGEKRKIFRNGPMFLNNRGDVVELVSREGEIVHKVEYPRVREGVVVPIDASR